MWIILEHARGNHAASALPPVRIISVVDQLGDGERVAASLADQIDGLTFVDRTTDQVTALLIDTVMTWARAQGWRAYRRAQSVVPLPQPYAHRHSCVDVGCARQAGAPVVVEIDHSDRRRTVEKLLAEAAAGRISIWVRWSAGGIEAPPAPIILVTCHVTSRRGVGTSGQVHSRLPADDRPAPEHSHHAHDTDQRQPDLFA